MLFVCLWGSGGGGEVYWVQMCQQGCVFIQHMTAHNVICRLAASLIDVSICRGIHNIGKAIRNFLIDLWWIPEMSFCGITPKILTFEYYAKNKTYSEVNFICVYQIWSKLIETKMVTTKFSFFYFSTSDRGDFLRSIEITLFNIFFILRSALKIMEKISQVCLEMHHFLSNSNFFRGRAPYGFQALHI